MFFLYVRGFDNQYRPQRSNVCPKESGVISDRPYVIGVVKLTQEEEETLTLDDLIKKYPLKENANG